MAHWHWIVTASRALRLYVSMEKPLNIFTLVIQYIIIVYSTLWFKIKCNCTIFQASLDILKTLSKCQRTLLEVKDIVILVIEHNAYGADHKSILTVMISSINLNYNELVWRKILSSRKQQVSERKI